MPITVSTVTTEPLTVTTNYCLSSQNPLPFVWKLLSCSFKMSKFMSLSFIFWWHQHFSLMIIQIFTEKHFSSNFWTTDPLNMVDPSFFSFLRDPHTDNTLVANKYTKNIKQCWMRLKDAAWRIFPEIDSKLLTSAKISHERLSNT